MTTLLEIKAATERLTPREYADLMAMLHPSIDDEWDCQVAADAAAGRLDHLVAEAVLAWLETAADRSRHEKNRVRFSSPPTGKPSAQASRTTERELPGLLSTAHRVPADHTTAREIS